MRRATASLLLCLLLLATVRSWADEAGVRLDVPYVRQVKDGCGSAAIAMILSYWNDHGHSVNAAVSDAAAIHRNVYSAAAGGSPAAEVERYFADAGFRTYAFEGTWSDLAEHAAKGRPLLVALRPPGAVGQLHFVVVAGVSAGHVLVHDPAQKPYLLLDRATFEARWNASQRWTLLALPRP